jgi:hypothetical protein
VILPALVLLPCWPTLLSGGGDDPDSMRSRVLLRPGTCHLRNGERLVLYRCKTRPGDILRPRHKVTGLFCAGYLASFSGAAPHFVVTHEVHFATASLRAAGTAPGT